MKSHPLFSIPMFCGEIELNVKPGFRSPWAEFEGYDFKRRLSFGGFHGHGGTPSHHPFLGGIFPSNHPFLGYLHGHGTPHFQTRNHINPYRLIYYMLSSLLVSCIPMEPLATHPSLIRRTCQLLSALGVSCWHIYPEKGEIWHLKILFWLVVWTPPLWKMMDSSIKGRFYMPPIFLGKFKIHGSPSPRPKPPSSVFTCDCELLGEHTYNILIAWWCDCWIPLDPMGSDWMLVSPIGSIFFSDCASRKTRWMFVNICPFFFMWIYVNDRCSF